MTQQNNSIKNILIVGTGGQGVITASEILCDVAMSGGFDTKKSEIHGMSQRGGVVTSHVRYGRQVFSPLIQEGDADILLSFELAETVRWIHFLKPEGRVISNLQRIVPPAVSSGSGKYPEDAEAIIKARSNSPVLLDALPMAEELGNPRLVNTLLLSATSTLLDLPVDLWKEVVANRVPPKFKDLNMIAFDKGRALMDAQK
ncbi:MAG: indolepyruvate oxidoreductase subunit beta [Deltaproteobacteria bacterium]|nr:indolepyruvate oxidoreductase subunit beta [Deltaproteobacteria bacterium]